MTNQGFHSGFASGDTKFTKSFFGSPSGPPMFPVGAYNSNYLIVQTADYLMIMSEMVHDADHPDW